MHVCPTHSGKERRRSSVLMPKWCWLAASWTWGRTSTSWESFPSTDSFLSPTSRWGEHRTASILFNITFSLDHAWHLLLNLLFFVLIGTDQTDDTYYFPPFCMKTKLLKMNLENDILLKSWLSQIWKHWEYKGAWIEQRRRQTAVVQ